MDSLIGLFRWTFGPYTGPGMPILMTAILGTLAYLAKRFDKFEQTSATKEHVSVAVLEHEKSCRDAREMAFAPGRGNGHAIARGEG